MHLIFCCLFTLFTLSGEVTYPRLLDAAPIKLSLNDRILLYTPCRTGSTFVYNVFNYLCEDILWIPNQEEDKRVRKTHHPDRNGILKKLLLDGRNVILVVTVRNPIDSAISFCNMVNVSYKNGAIHFARVIAKEFIGIKKSITPAIVLRYEEFNDNLPFLLDKIEELLKGNISWEVREEVEMLFSRKAMKAIADHLDILENVDPLTQMHGKHVDKELSKYMASSSTKEAMLPYLAEAMRVWGYRIFN